MVRATNLGVGKEYATALSANKPDMAERILREAEGSAARHRELECLRGRIMVFGQPKQGELLTLWQTANEERGRPHEYRKAVYELETHLRKAEADRMVAKQRRPSNSSNGKK